MAHKEQSDDVHHFLADIISLALVLLFESSHRRQCPFFGMRYGFLVGAHKNFEIINFVHVYTECI